MIIFIRDPSLCLCRRLKFKVIMLRLPLTFSAPVSLSPVLSRRLCNRLMMSSACSSAALPTDRPSSVTRPATGIPRTTRKRKLAVLVGYDGAFYHGFQRNAGVRTISDELEEAFHSVGLISDANFGTLSKTSLACAARTDKGVSAAGNVVSFKAELPRTENSDSPEALRAIKEGLNAVLPSHVQVFQIVRVSSKFNARAHCDNRGYEYFLEPVYLDGVNLDEFQSVLKHFEGSHFFHNYTIGDVHSIPPPAQARRLIRSIGCERVREGWVRVHIFGQSFIMHQIRKMVAMAVLVSRGTVDISAIRESFRPDILLNVPPAPAIGLFLDHCGFESYNRKLEADKWVTHTQCEVEREQFKLDHILPSIARRTRENSDTELFFRCVDRHASSLEAMKASVSTPRVPYDIVTR